MDYIYLLQSARLETFLNSALEIGIALLICLASLWASYRSKKRSDLDEIEDGELRRPLGSRQKILAPSTLRPLIIGIAAAVLTVSFGVDIAIDIARINRDISEESYIVYEGEAKIVGYRKIGLSFEKDGEIVEVRYHSQKIVALLSYERALELSGYREIAYIEPDVDQSVDDMTIVPE